MQVEVFEKPKTSTENPVAASNVYVHTCNVRVRIQYSGNYEIVEAITADGKFDKLKSRLVAGGHLQDRNIYDNG